MYKICKTEQSAQRQRQLELGLLSLMNQRRYEDISVSDLCAFIGIPRKAFYRYFSGKDGALYALLDHTMMEFDLSPEAYNPEEERSALKDLETFFLFWQSRRGLLDALQKSGLTGVLMERAMDHVSHAMVPIRFLAGLDKWEQGQVMTFGTCGLMVMMINWHRSGFDRSPRDLARVAYRLLSQPLYPEG